LRNSRAIVLYIYVCVFGLTLTMRSWVRLPVLPHSRSRFVTPPHAAFAPKRVGIAGGLGNKRMMDSHTKALKLKNIL